MNQRFSNAQTTHRTRSLREQESALTMNVARRKEHQASTALQVSRFDEPRVRTLETNPRS